MQDGRGFNINRRSTLGRGNKNGAPAHEGKFDQMRTKSGDWWVLCSGEWRIAVTGPYGETVDDLLRKPEVTVFVQ